MSLAEIFVNCSRPTPTGADGSAVTGLGLLGIPPLASRRLSLMIRRNAPILIFITILMAEVRRD